MEFMTSLGWVGWAIIAVAVAIAWNWRRLRQVPDRVDRKGGTLQHYSDGRPDQPPGIGGNLE